MTIHELIKLAVKKLEHSSSTSPALDGEVLLSYVLNKPKEYLLTNPHRLVPTKLEKKYLTLINRRILGWPVAYLTKQKEFYKLKFYVDKNVLIPRPETEGLVELALTQLPTMPKARILDVGTGSGCIIITLAKHLPRGYQFFASDSSPRAIAIAKKNAKLHRVKIKFADGNLLEPWGNQVFDLIVANLPYLSRRTDESTRFEPTGALIAAKRGLKLYEELFRQIAFFSPPFKGEIKRRYHPKNKNTSPNPSLKEGEKPKYLLLEIGRDQGHLIKKLAAKHLPAYKCQTFKDLAGRYRYAVLAKKSSSAYPDPPPHRARGRAV